MGVNLETHSCPMTEKKLVLIVFTISDLEHAGSSFAQLMQVCVTSGSEWSEFQKVLFENRYLHSAHPVNLQIINALCFQRRNQEKLLWLQNAGLKTNRADCFLVVDCGPGGIKADPASSGKFV